MPAFCNALRRIFCLSPPATEEPKSMSVHPADPPNENGIDEKQDGRSSSPPTRLSTLLGLAHPLINKIFPDHGYQPKDVDDLLEYLPEILALLPPDDPQRDPLLTFFREALFVRFSPPPEFTLSVSDTQDWNRDAQMQFGCPSHIKESISRHRKLLAQGPPGQYDDPEALISVAEFFFRRFEEGPEAGSLSEQDNASEGEDAYEESDTSELDDPSDMKDMLEEEGMGEEEDAHEEEDMSEENTLDEDALTHGGASKELDRGLEDLFAGSEERLGQSGQSLDEESPPTESQLEDLERAIEYGEAALKLCPPNHDDRRFILDKVAQCLLSRFKVSGKSEDIDRSITYLREALELRPLGEYMRVLVFASLKQSLESVLSRPDRSQIPGRLLQEPEYLSTFRKEVVAIPLSNLHHKLSMAQIWLDLGVEANLPHTALMEVHNAATGYFERCLVLRHSLETQHEFLSMSGNAVDCNLAAALIGQNQFASAVEVLEHGRSVLWSRMRGYRHSLDGLREKDASLADKFEHVCRRLEGLATSSQLSPSTVPEVTQFEEMYSRLETLAASSKKFTLSYTESQFDKIRVFRRKEEHQALLQELESMITDIRRIDGFSHFLQAAPFAELRQAASKGPVIILNISERRSDALILTDHGETPVVCVALDKDVPNIVTRLSTDVRRMEQAIRRGSKPANLGKKDGLTALLRILWSKLCEPIVEQLLRMGTPEQSRIWWCPTGSLTQLPIHAAGPYKGGKQNLPDIFVSSYTPTLAALIQAHTLTVPRTAAPRLLAVGQSRDLPNVKEELRRIDAIFGTQGSVLRDTSAAPDAVLSSLRSCSWVHFACHGVIDEEQPFQSAFKLHGGRLPLRQIMEVRLTNAELAVLATCHSAAGETNMPDEMLSLAVALQFCGFRSTVGTLWEMRDTDGPELAAMFYGYLLREGGGDARRSAEALRWAAVRMRDAGVPAERWATFVHIGA